MKLVSSNDSAAVEDIVAEAIKTYRETSDVSKTLNVLTKLRGIGPATASLLLAVHQPDKVPFFSDEVYYWLCNNGRSESLKYNMKEYGSLISKSQDLMARLDVGAMDVEKAAYVLMKQGAEGPGSDRLPLTQSKKSAAPAPEAPAKKQTPTSVKRKTSPAAALEEPPSLRRSKRGKGA